MHTNSSRCTKYRLFTGPDFSGEIVPYILHVVYLPLDRFRTQSVMMTLVEKGPVSLCANQSLIRSKIIGQAGRVLSGPIVGYRTDARFQTTSLDSLA